MWQYYYFVWNAENERIWVFCIHSNRCENVWWFCVLNIGKFLHVLSLIEYFFINLFACSVLLLKLITSTYPTESWSWSIMCNAVLLHSNWHTRNRLIIASGQWPVCTNFSIILVRASYATTIITPICTVHAAMPSPDVYSWELSCTYAHSMLYIFMMFVYKVKLMNFDSDACRIVDDCFNRCCCFADAAVELILLKYLTLHWKRIMTKKKHFTWFYHRLY